MNFTGKRILITGASSGIGAALAMTAVGQDATVVGVARRDDRLLEVAERAGQLFTPIVCDLEQTSAVDRIRSLGHFDCVIANAGRGSTIMPLDLNHESLDAMMHANVYTAMHTLHGALPNAQRGDIFVFVGSILGRIPYAPWRSAYNASKAALAALIVGWRQELYRRGIRVLLVNPGLTKTEFQSTANPESIKLPELHSDSRRFPSMVPQTPDEVAMQIMTAIESDHDEAYTRAETARWVAEYYSELASGRDSVRNLLDS
jgi:short-subunit dehydrogenase